MAEFVLRDVALSIPDTMLTDNLTQALKDGRYEHTEANALSRHLRAGDRLLDCGAGAGYLCVLASRAGATCAGVEAGRETAETARANLARNGVDGTIEWGAVVPDSFTDDRVLFAMTRAFWASTLVPRNPGNVRRMTEVPALRIGTLLQQFTPTVLVVDIEGAEESLFETPLPDHVRLLVMEIHPGVYGRAGVAQIFADLARSGFVYCPQGSVGNTLVFERV